MKNSLLIFFSLIFCSVIYADQKPILSCNNKIVLGRFEKVLLVDKKLILEAKLDTGADMTSLSAVDIIKFNKKNKPWVRFTVISPSTHEKIIFVKPLVDSISIRKRNEENSADANEFSTRPVISMPIKLQNDEEDILVNLADRTHFRYPILLGCNALQKFKVIVDVSQDHVTGHNPG